MVQYTLVQYGCTIGKLPLTYLGLPIGSSIGRKESWDGVVQNFKVNFSSWKTTCLSVGGNATLIKSILWCLGIYFMLISKVPVGVLGLGHEETY